MHETGIFTIRADNRDVPVNSNRVIKVIPHYYLQNLITRNECLHPETADRRHYLVNTYSVELFSEITVRVLPSGESATWCPKESLLLRENTRKAVVYRLLQNPSGTRSGKVIHSTLSGVKTAGADRQSVAVRRECEGFAEF